MLGLRTRERWWQKRSYRTLILIIHTETTTMIPTSLHFPALPSPVPLMLVSLLSLYHIGLVG